MHPRRAGGRSKAHWLRVRCRALPAISHAGVSGGPSTRAPPTRASACSAQSEARAPYRGTLAARRGPRRGQHAFRLGSIRLDCLRAQRAAAQLFECADGVLRRQPDAPGRRVPRLRLPAGSRMGSRAKPAADRQSGGGGAPSGERAARLIGRYGVRCMLCAARTEARCRWSRNGTRGTQ